MSKLQNRRALIILGLSGTSLAAAEALTPRTKLSQLRPLKVDLERMVPKNFGKWKSLDDRLSAVVNPVVQENLNRIYSQLLSRTYVDPSGRRVMVSVAYGEDQRKSLAVHYPEVCYPAQGFSVLSNVMAQTKVASEVLPLRRLETVLGRDRYEAVTYWTTMGDYTSFGGFPRRMIELRYGLDRLIPDGLLFRVSTIGRDSKEQFVLQEAFVREMLEGLAPNVRQVLTGKLQQ